MLRQLQRAREVWTSAFHSQIAIIKQFKSLGTLCSLFWSLYSSVHRAHEIDSTVSISPTLLMPLSAALAFFAETRLSFFGFSLFDEWTWARGKSATKTCIEQRAGQKGAVRKNRCFDMYRNYMKNDYLIPFMLEPGRNRARFLPSFENIMKDEEAEDQRDENQDETRRRKRDSKRREKSHFIWTAGIQYQHEIEWKSRPAYTLSTAGFVPKVKYFFFLIFLGQMKRNES